MIQVLGWDQGESSISDAPVRPAKASLGFSISTYCTEYK